MTKAKKAFIAIAVLFLFWSALSLPPAYGEFDPQDSPTLVMDQDVQEDSFETTEILIKVAAGVSAEEATQYIKGQMLLTLAGQARASAPVGEEEQIKIMFPFIRLPQQQQQSGGENTTTAGNLQSWYKVPIPEGSDVLALCEELENLAGIEKAQPNYTSYRTMGGELLPTVSTMPNDPHIEDPENPGYWNHGALSEDIPDLYGHRNIKVLEAWDHILSNEMEQEVVIVAVLDTGIDRTHEDLRDVIWINPGEEEGDANGDGFPGEGGVDDDGDGLIDEDAAGNSRFLADGISINPDWSNDIPFDDDENGFPDDIHGWDFSSNDNDPTDVSNGHGSHVSGTIAATGDNGVGLSGIASGKTNPVRIMALRGLGGGTTSEGLAAALVYAADNGARIINNSWGYPIPHPSDPVIEDAVRYVVSRGVLPVFSAGNSRFDIQLVSPQNMPEVFAVSAADDNNELANFSNWGEGVAVAAPGVRTLSVSIGAGNEYSLKSGTSMASPHVVGLAALLLSVYPEYTVEDLRLRLEATTQPLYVSGLPRPAGTGVIDALGALLAVNPIQHIAIIKIEESEVSEDTRSLIVTLKNTWLPANDVVLRIETDDPLIQIVESTALIDRLEQGEIASFADNTLLISGFADLPAGYQVFITIHLSTAEGFTHEQEHLMTKNFFGDCASSFNLSFPDGLRSGSFGDYDNDGDVDLLVTPTNSHDSKLYRNENNMSFLDVTDAAGLTWTGPDTNYSGVGMLVDYTGDGWLDIALDEASVSEFFLRRNEGGLTFVPDQPGSEDYLWDMGFVDFDTDGDLDLITMDVTGISRGDGIKVYENINGNYVLVFVFPDDMFGFFNLSDYDQDNDVDVLISGLTSSGAGFFPYLFRNDGNFTFVDATAEAGLPTDIPAAELLRAFGDLNNDGLVDYVTNADARGADEPFKIFLNNGDGTFSDSGNTDVFLGEYGLVTLTLFDFDNNGYLDLFFTRYLGGNRFFRNNGNLSFTDESLTTGFRDLGDHFNFGPSLGDFTGDGFVDMYFPQTTSPSRLLCNEVSQFTNNHWLKVSLVGEHKNSHGIGAKVLVTVGGETQIREVGLDHKMEPAAYFGLGVHNIIDLLEVRWPSGTITQHTDIAVDQGITIAEVDTSISQPANLQLVEVSSYFVYLTWEDHSDNEDGFVVVRRKPDGSEEVTFELPADATSFANTAYEYSTTYEYWVYAFNAHGNSAPSNTITVVDPFVKTNISVFKIASARPRVFCLV